MLRLAAVSLAMERSPAQAGTMASKCHALIMIANAVYFPALNWLPIGLNLWLSRGNSICIHLRRKAGKSYVFQSISILLQPLSEAVLF